MRPFGVGIIGSLMRPVCLLAILAVSGCGLVRRPPLAIDRSQDDRIFREVTARLASEPALDGREIRVEVDGAVVRLYGSVSGIDAWNCAVLNAQLVESVRTVVEFLVIERGPRTATCGLGSYRRES